MIAAMPSPLRDTLYLEDEALRHRIRTQLNKGEKLHDLRKFLFFAREGVVSQQYEDGQSNQAGCLNLLTNAVIVWNTMYMQAGVAGVISGKFSVREMATKSPLVARHDYI
jgi:TnpA family transposase